MCYDRIEMLLILQRTWFGCCILIQSVAGLRRMALSREEMNRRCRFRAI